MAGERPRLKQVLALVYFVGALAISFFLFVLDQSRPATLPVKIAIWVAWLLFVPLATGVTNKLRFKIWRRRGWTEFWVRSPEPLPGGLADKWVRGLLSVRTPLVDFVPDEHREGAWVKPATFLVSDWSRRDRGHLKAWDFLAMNFGPGVRMVSLQTTRGVIDVAGYPEALDQLEAELSLANVPAVG